MSSSDPSPLSSHCHALKGHGVIFLEGFVMEHSLVYRGVKYTVIKKIK